MIGFSVSVSPPWLTVIETRSLTDLQPGLFTPTKVIMNVPSPRRPEIPKLQAYPRAKPQAQKLTPKHLWSPSTEKGNSCGSSGCSGNSSPELVLNLASPSDSKALSCDEFGSGGLRIRDERWNARSLKAGDLLRPGYTILQPTLPQNGHLSTGQQYSKKC